MTVRLKATAQIVRNFQELFVNRRAYSMQSLRPHPETGRHYYFRPGQKGTDVPLMLTDSSVRQHRKGEIMGVYRYVCASNGDRFANENRYFASLLYRSPTIVTLNYNGDRHWKALYGG